MSVLISGVLMNPAGVPVSGAEVTFSALTNGPSVLNGFSASVMTDQDGNYAIPLEICEYAISIQSDGYNSVYGSVSINEKSTPTTINALLKLAAMEQTVTPAIIVYFREIQADVVAKLATMQVLGTKATEAASAAAAARDKAAQYAQSLSAAVAQAQQASTSATASANAASNSVNGALVAKNAAETAAGNAQATLAGAMKKSANGSDIANTTTFRENIGAAPLNSPALTGTPTAPTASAATNNTQLATTAFVTSANSATLQRAVRKWGALGSTDLNTVTGLQDGDYTQNITSNATLARNYPIAQAGLLEVRTSGANNPNSCMQSYKPYNTIRNFYRIYNGTEWTAWGEDWNSLNYPDWAYPVPNTSTAMAWFRVASLGSPGASPSRLVFMMQSGGIASPNGVVDIVSVSAKGVTTSTTFNQELIDNIIEHTRIVRAPSAGAAARIGAVKTATGVDFYINSNTYNLGNSITLLTMTGATYYGADLAAQGAATEPAGIIYATPTDPMFTNRAQTITGEKLLQSTASPLQFIAPGTGANSVIYIPFFSLGRTTRFGWIGKGASAVDDLRFRNDLGPCEINLLANGGINLGTSGAGIVTWNGAEIVNTASVQTIGGQKVFTESPNFHRSGNAGFNVQNTAIAETTVGRWVQFVNDGSSTLKYYIRAGANGIPVTTNQRIIQIPIGGSGTVLATGNNVVADANGFYKAASPVINIYADGLFSATDEADSVNVERLSEGIYHISGCLGLNADRAWGGDDGGITNPKCRNGLERIWNDYKIEPDGSIIVKTYHRIHKDAPEFASNRLNLDKKPYDVERDGSAEWPDLSLIDIPKDVYLQVRVQMPEKEDALGVTATRHSNVYCGTVSPS
ncbi:MULTISPECIES: prophage tail fiber N-terminal domain-containing protein [Pectobacterium]|uniref:phage tail fiber protein n=1 Tax=Pectobacterium TaxID=122277 RepID=UPI0013FDC338|nr:prophage tail fiber N-terminal domain-containing protein [Pectobacterium parvum]UVD99403.1 prophage tail fiber N-terminal domain-containing protein [Pectobacterium parvum]